MQAEVGLEWMNLRAEPLARPVVRHVLDVSAPLIWLCCQGA